MTTSSGGAQSIVEPSESGVTYAQVVFPPDRRKPDDGSTSPKRLAVPANVPLHLLSESDVRSQLGNLKSFNPPKQEADRGLDTVDTDDVVVTQPQVQAVLPITRDLHPNHQPQPESPRPQSPETDF